MEYCKIFQNDCLIRDLIKKYLPEIFSWCIFVTVTVRHGYHYYRRNSFRHASKRYCNGKVSGDS